MSKWHPPDSWDEAKYEDLLTRIQAEADDLTNQRAAEAWNHHHEYLNAVVRAWSWAVVRHVKAICQLLRSEDVITPLGLMRELRERAIDLGLLLHYKNKAVGYSDVSQTPRRHTRFNSRCQAALAARLTQALTHFYRGLEEPGWQRADWSALRNEIRAMERIVPYDIFEQIDKRAKEWRRFRHWSGIDDDQLRGRLSEVDPIGDSLAAAKMSIQLHGSLSLMELDRIPQGGNRTEYHPSRKATPEMITTIGLVVWFYLRVAARAAGNIHTSGEC